MTVGVIAPFVVGGTAGAACDRWPASPPDWYPDPWQPYQRRWFDPRGTVITLVLLANG